VSCLRDSARIAREQNPQPMLAFSAAANYRDLNAFVLAEFERGRLRERVLAGLQRARRQGRRLGRPQALFQIAFRRSMRVPVDRATPETERRFVDAEALAPASDEGGVTRRRAPSSSDVPVS
jgi:hypothetical protein